VNDAGPAPSLARALLEPLLHLADLRSRYTSLPYGDQALFVRAAVFRRVGGFPEQPLMEDIELSKRLKRKEASLRDTGWGTESDRGVLLMGRTLGIVGFGRIGSGVAPSMVRKGYDQDLDVRAVSVKVSEKPSPLFKTETGEFRFMRDQLWWMVREWLRTDKGAMLPPDEILREDLLAPEYTVKPNGKIEITSKEVLRDQLKRSPDRGDALCMTFAPFSRPTWISVGDIIYRQTPAHEPVNQGGDTFAEWVDR